LQAEPRYGVAGRVWCRVAHGVRFSRRRCGVRVRRWGCF
jgi:hypothetical protein